MPAFPRSLADLEAQRRLVAAILQPWTRAADLARRLGVTESCISNWVAGDRAPDLAVLRHACRETARQYPDHAPLLHRVLVEELLDLSGRLVLDEAGAAGSWLQESQDITRLHGRLVEAVEEGDAIAIERLAARAHVDVDEAITAARREITARGGAPCRTP